jgi:large subunit ribosomal protein L4e
MKLQILDKSGKKIKEKETKLFEEPIRLDIIAKVVEAEKTWQPWSPRFRAGMDISASGNVTHRRHVWKSDRGKGSPRIPKQTMWRRGTQFSWVGAIIPGTRGGRRAHPPKGEVNDKKINKKELLKALRSALSYVADVKFVQKKYSSLKCKEVKMNLPLIVEDKILSLNTKDFLASLKGFLGDMNSVAVQNKSIRAGIGKMRGRKYKKNAGLLFVVGDKENKSVNGIEVIKVGDLIVSDLASNGARLVMFSENAIEELENILIGSDSKREKKIKKERADRRKIKKAKTKKINAKSKKTKLKSKVEVKEDA